MSEKPEIKVGQRWVRAAGDVVRVLAIDGKKVGYPVIVETDEGETYAVTYFGFAAIIGPHGSPQDLIELAPSTIKRKVALYRGGNGHVSARDEGQIWVNAVPISEPVEIEFTLLPGEEA